MFGTPGPDAGYALVLLAGRDIPKAEGEKREDVIAALAALMVARASHLGRAPVAEDADVAELLLGYRSAAGAEGRAPVPASSRAEMIASAARHPATARALVAAVGIDILTASPEEVERRLSSGVAGS
jgi:hypothetical protein